MPFLNRFAAPSQTLHPELNPDAVIKSISPLLSHRRKQRIEQVVCQRLVSVTVVLENLYDPHNGAAVLRTCEAMGLLHVHVVEKRVPFRFSRKVSKNSHKWLNIYRHATAAECFTFLEHANFSCWAAMPPPLGCNHHLALPRMKAPQPIALVFGNEHEGLSPEAQKYCKGRFSLPMVGFTESLNLSVSVAITLSQVVAARRSILKRTGDLTEETVKQLKAAYYANSTRHASDIVWGRLKPGTSSSDG